jgi:hypothetical protein
MKDLAGATRVLNWTAHQVSCVYRPTGHPGLEVLVHILSSAYCLELESAEQHQHSFSADRFCQTMDQLFEELIPYMAKDWRHTTGFIPKWLPTFNTPAA